ncbi:MAG: glycosyltransferase [Candidatus Staskawiczbacteria bacterium]|nr:glycosyltransferase [Candidatus Staskawiczbacteria bacterium]
MDTMKYMPKIKLSVIIPIYNGEKDLERGVLDEVDKYLKEQDYDYEVLIVDDGSSDNTVDVALKQINNKTGFRLIKNPHKGKAVTVMTGLLESHGEITVFTDIDQSTPLKEIEKFFPKFEKGFDIVIGSRSGRAGAPIVRKIVALGFAVLRTLILGLTISDTQCGFKAFNRQSIELIFTNMIKRYQNVTVSGRALNANFDVEFLYLAGKKHLKIAEVKVYWHDENPQNAHLIKNAIDALKGMIQVKLQDLKGKYD